METACREDEEQRAGRTIDWIGERVGRRCARWVDAMEKGGEDELLKDAAKGIGHGRTPWWEEMRRCVEGDNVPSRAEGWSHPAASAF